MSLPPAPSGLGGWGGDDAATVDLAGVLTVAAVAWLPLNKSVEGPKLLVLSRNHAIVTADLLSVLLVLIAAVLVLPRRSWRAGRAARDTVRR